MKTDGASENYLREFFQSEVDLDGCAVFHRTELNQSRSIVCVVIDGADALGDKRRQQFCLLIRPHGAMNAGGKDDRYVAGCGAVLYQTPHEQVDDLRTGRSACSIRGDDQDVIAGLNHVVERW